MIGVIDTGISNSKSVTMALRRLNLRYKLVCEDISDCDRFIIPGVGNFSKLSQALSFELKNRLKETNKPVLGICLGMQFLFDHSEEGDGSGLGVFRRDIKKLPLTILPHMGWNDLKLTQDDPLFRGIKTGDDFYFVHSFACLDNDDTIATTCVEGITFSSVVKRDNFYGVQFHPEKSARLGERLLFNFSELI